MRNKLSEIQITPVKPIDGLVGFASVVFDENFYLGGIGVYTRPMGGYRLTYPIRKSHTGNLNVFHPINRSIADCLEQAVAERFEEIMSK